MEITKNTRINNELKLKTYDSMQKMKKRNFTRQEIIHKLHIKSQVSLQVLYGWYSNKYTPHGRKGKVIFKPKLFYIIGALLGDGCLYNWKITYNYIILVGDKAFTTKYAKILSLCTGVKSKPYIDRNKNIYFVRNNNYMLYRLFEKARKNTKYLERLLHLNKGYMLPFVEGFFDAEGCVKIIKEKTRHLPKICLDFTNTNINYLEIIRKILKNQLKIEARHSIQKQSGNRKTVYHLRIYKKASVRIFFEKINTTKLKKEKITFVQNWLENDYNPPLLYPN